ncbi:MAG: DUF2914 domain-containing protein [Myxococcales bacterium]|nr:DUF2914 domain-containing protein [Myxococcales bacterium]
MGARRTTQAAALAAFAVVFGLAGCDGSKTEDSAKPAPDALAKPPELMKPAAGEQAGAPAKKLPATQPAEVPSRADQADAAADDGDDAADDGEKDVASEKPSPKKRASTKREHGRKRVSSGPKEETPEDADEPAPLKVKRIQFAESIEAREPVDPEETFASSELDKLYAFVELTNETKQKSKIVVRFIPPSGSSTKVTLDVGDKSRWRTWALRRGVKAVGTWTVVVTDAAGDEIGRRTFEVTE